MKEYRITGQAGEDLGTYVAASPELAIESMAVAAGYSSQAEALSVISPDDLDRLVLGLDYVGTDGTSISGLRVEQVCS